MKIKTKQLDYDEVLKISPPCHRNPKKPNIFFRTLVNAAGKGDLKDADFSYSVREGTDLSSPSLILMNHSSFIDLEIVSEIMYPRPYNIICTSDGFVGKEWLMRSIGCVPTQKFVTDITLIKDMIYSLEKLKISVLMYPEASYSFDGCATPLPRKLGMLLKRLNVNVIMIKTEGAFARDPLYNMLQKRKVKVSAEAYTLLTKEQIMEYDVDTLDGILDDAFTFDNFAWQRENNISIDEDFRADGLNRILYKCPCCETEGEMLGKGTKLSCGHCGKEWELDRYGRLVACGGDGRFGHIPDWYRWERECVRKEIEEVSYRMECDCDIGVMADYSAIYMIGKGKLVHDCSGFTLTGAEGRLEYHRKPGASYGLYSDYYWYEIGDVICIGDRKRLYYCFPDGGGIVAKTRTAAEEMYKKLRI